MRRGIAMRGLATGKAAARGRDPEAGRSGHRARVSNRRGPTRIAPMWWKRTGAETTVPCPKNTDVSVAYPSKTEMEAGDETEIRA